MARDARSMSKPLTRETLNYTGRAKKLTSKRAAPAGELENPDFICSGQDGAGKES